MVGSGLGGLTAALRAHALGHEVTLVSKGDLDESNSRWAQGGIAAAVFDDDSVDLHVGDTMVAGAGLSVLDAVRVLCGDGASRIQDLVRWGVEFDRVGASDSGVADAAGHVEPAWARGLEAAHSRARVLHAGGDATGAAIVRALAGSVEAAGIRILPHTLVTDLLLAADDPRRVVGVSLLGDGDGDATELRADAVVLASGGAGQLFEFTTNPAVATGDGLAAAWRAGATVGGLEFFQFHPTALAVPGSFLVSEAVRGEGAVLLDSAGRRFMPAVDRRAELAPRDVVARGIFDLMQRQAGLPALLDATGIGAQELAARFPTITKATLRAGFDWTREAIPVTPAAHYFMGGVATDLDGRTSLEGLYAVGEVASTGVHGANRLASNSLLEALVFGWRAADAIESDTTGSWMLDDASTLDAVRPPSGAPLGVADRGELQRLMWRAAGVKRDGATLAAAAETLAGWAGDGAGVEDRDETPARSSAPDIAASARAAARERVETANLLDVARLVVDSALAREESRGAHFRTDFPETSSDPAQPSTLARKVFDHADR
ncbi:L-aspartate oxidase [Frondihabitans australicus]|uniref:L-aspartate oxidase n=1 Tax=Frondihabitans australicus TaxID=386892 RepID=UPI001FE7D5E1|nr:L-aspartate oxidase [Frondihabitans australicus]